LTNAMLIIYGKEADNEKRYSPPTCIGTETNVMTGEPDPAHISTSYVERRFTRLTNALRESRILHMPSRCIACTATSPARTWR
jgi:hypothetical protein